jgi:TolB-like protein
VPVMIEACERPIMFELTQTADLSGWNGDASDKTWLAFASDVRRYMSSGEVPAVAKAPAVAPALTTGSPRRNGMVIAISIAALLLVAGTAQWWLSRPHDKQSAAQGPTPSAAQDTAAVTLAVLPFANLSSDPEQEYFSDGLTEEILNQLAQISALRVTGRTSSFSFEGKNEDLRAIGEKLGVANLLEGSIRKDGNHLRINAQLINSSDGAQLWSRTYDRELKNVFAIQEEVAKDVAKALSIKLDVGDLPRIEGGTTHIEAYDKYLQARKLSQLNGAAEFRQAAALLRVAVDLDPQFSRAWMALAGTLIQLQRSAPSTAESGTTPEEVAATIEQVLKLTPNSWGAQLLRGVQFTSLQNWAQADAAFAAMTAAGAPISGNDDVTIGRGRFLRAVGRIREAVGFYERAVDEDSLSLYASVDLQTWLDAVGRSTEAQDEYERSRELIGNHGESEYVAISRMLLRKDAGSAAIKAQIARWLQSSNTSASAPLSRAVVANLDKPEQMRELLRKALDDPSNQNRYAQHTIAIYAARFEDKDVALAALKRVVIDFRNVDRLWLPLAINLRTDPRFKEIVLATGLVDYWRSSDKWGDFCKPVGTDDFVCQ